MAKPPKKIFFRGYTKKENKHWVAVCIDLNIVAQGATADEAQQECRNLIRGYIDYVCSEYPDRIDEYIPRYAPKELVDEFHSIVSKIIGNKKQPKAKRLSDYSFDPRLTACAAN